MESLRNWVKQAEIDGGQRPGTSTDEAKRIAELEREVRELRRANEILKAASTFSRENSTPDRPDERLHRRSPRPVRPTGRPIWSAAPSARRRRTGSGALT
ncbi:hypothetical protein [Streptosporangium canum]|uniref:hypothetical protein n=1 Tax=Streptosporangium canum TaxID=324952 RepID=UPI00342FB985